MTKPNSRVMSRRARLGLGPIPITPLGVLIAVLIVGAPSLMLYAIASVKDERQIPLLEVGAAGLTLGFALWALASLRAMWIAASAARSGRAMVFAIIGGLAGIAAIGSFAVALILTLVWSS